MRRLLIGAFLQGAKNALLLDVRSPAEYSHAHIPGAVSFPLFSDEERKVVGTAYKQESREKAIKIGLDYFGPKMRPMVERVEELVQHFKQESSNGTDAELSASSPVFIYCWRGGMRSGAVAWLLNLYGFDVHILTGGYKSFRGLCIEALAKDYAIKILGGFTGSGKTELLQALKAKGRAVIDLEKLANHRGSAFGKMGDGTQPSQEMFENLLALELMKWGHAEESPDGDAPFIHNKKEVLWVEDESQRIGRVNIPTTLWHTLRHAPLYFLNIPFESRLNYLLHEYGAEETEALIAATERISKRLGGLEAKNTIQLLNEGNIREAFRILLRYYDKLYLKGLHNRQNLSTLLHEIQSEAVSSENAELLLTLYQTV